MIYSFDGRVRYSEIGENGLLTLPGVLNYFQDCSTFQSEEVGLGIKVLKEWKRFWVLSAWQVIVERYPAMGEQIRTSTWAYGFRGFMGFRNFTMDTMEGERLAYANTFWTYINRENDFPVKLTERDTEGYGLDGLCPTENRFTKGIYKRRCILCSKTSSGYKSSCKQLPVCADGNGLSPREL